MASGMEYDSPYKAHSPFSYEVEEGELSSGSGRSSPGTIRDNASDCSTQTDDQMATTNESVTTFRVELDNTPENVQTPQEIAGKLKNKFDNIKRNEDRRNLQSFNRNNSNNTTNEQGTNTAIHSYQNNRPLQNNNRSNTDSYISPPFRIIHHQCDRLHPQITN